MGKSRRRFTAAFKTEVVLEALSERYTVQELARKHELHPNQITTWKRQFLDNAETVFDRPGKDAKSEEEREKDRMLKTIGQQKIEIDFLKRALS